MGNVKIVRMTNADEGFYQTLGPFLSRRDIVTEIGAPIWDDDGKEWFVAKIGRKIAGFAATRKVGKHMSLVSAYVLHEFRGQGVYASLVAARLKALGDVHIKAVATESAAKALTNAGLTNVSSRGKFAVLERLP